MNVYQNPLGCKMTRQSKPPQQNPLNNSQNTLNKNESVARVMMQSKYSQCDNNPLSLTNYLSVFKRTMKVDFNSEMKIRVHFVKQLKSDNNSLLFLDK